MAFQTGINRVGEVQNGVSIESRRFLKGHWMYQGICLTCRQTQSFTALTVSAGGASCRYCRGAQPFSTDTLQDAHRAERAEAERIQAEKNALSKAEQRAFDKRAAEQRAYQRVQKQYQQVYLYHSKYGTQQRFLEELPIERWLASSEFWRAEYAKRCGIGEDREDL